MGLSNSQNGTVVFSNIFLLPIGIIHDPLHAHLSWSTNEQFWLEFDMAWLSVPFNLLLAFSR